MLVHPLNPVKYLTDHQIERHNLAIVGMTTNHQVDARFCRGFKTSRPMIHEKYKCILIHINVLQLVPHLQHIIHIIYANHLQVIAKM